VYLTWNKTARTAHLTAHRATPTLGRTKRF
jgi:hypothetical protein